MSKSLNRFASVVFLGLLVAANEGTAAGQTGTPEEAKAMLERAVAALKADEPAALKAFNAGTEGFKDRDLYVLCGDATDGLITAHGANSALIGQSMRDIKDKAGCEPRCDGCDGVAPQNCTLSGLEPEEFCDVQAVQ
jgi:hypothetical protein